MLFSSRVFLSGRPRRAVSLDRNYSALRDHFCKIVACRDLKGTRKEGRKLGEGEKVRGRS